MLTIHCKGKMEAVVICKYGSISFFKSHAINMFITVQKVVEGDTKSTVIVPCHRRFKGIQGAFLDTLQRTHC